MPYQPIDESQYSQKPGNYSPQQSSAVKADVYQSDGYKPYSAPNVDKSASSGDYQGYKATTFNTGDGPAGENQVDVDKNSTVEGRMGGLLNRASEYMKAAETRALQLANRRGLLNSSMAVRSAQDAAVERALPIAQQDAATYAKFQSENLGYTNQATRDNALTDIQNRQYNAGLLSQANLAQAGYDADASKTNALALQDQANFNADALNKAATQFAESRNKESYAVLSAQLNSYLAQVDNDLAMQLKALESQYSLAENAASVNGAIYQELTRAAADIMTNTKDVAEAKARLKHLLYAAGYEMDFAGAAPDTYGNATGPQSGINEVIPEGPITDGNYLPPATENSPANEPGRYYPAQNYPR